MGYLKATINKFDALDEDDDREVDAPTSNRQRKAIKKLREIVELEKKTRCELNPDQLKKISEKQKWERELTPTTKTNNIHKNVDDIERKRRQHKKTQKRKRERKKREEKRRLREERERLLREEREERERLLREERERLLREERERFLREERERLLREERERLLREEKERLLREERERFLREERERLLNKKGCFDEFVIQNKIRDTFNELYKIHGDKKKVTRLLLLRYHPDKNIDNIGVAEMWFKIFEQMRGRGEFV
jgi:hypothetical protein